MLIYLAIVENWYYSSVTLLSVDSFTIHVPVRTSAYPWELPQAFAFYAIFPLSYLLYVDFASWLTTQCIDPLRVIPEVNSFLTSFDF
ncbi:MAG: hypothetical protein QNJ54_31760 [Prochloraceae cyanobacterium]|nr:hypothetical protein [Prochloraceae cyanobacterium]